MRKEIYKSLKKTITEKGGKYVDFLGVEYGYLIGITETTEDYYYLYIKSNLELGFSSTVCPLGKSYDNMPNNNFSVLNYMITNDIDGLIDLISKKLKNTGDKLLTPFFINNKKYNIY